MRNFNFSFRPCLENIQNGHKNLARMSTKNAKGITLVALVVTIVVLLILAGITIIMLFGENGIIKKAQDAADATKNNQNTTEQGLQNLENAMNEALGENGGSSGDNVAPKIKLANGTTVTLTKEIFGDYLGKKVANYKTVGGTESVTVGSNTYSVSTTYRLYYVDFDNKFGDGAGTVYLKADQGPNNYALQLDGAEATSKIKQLNPELYKEGVTTPTNTNNNMKAVTWLTDTAKWEGLVTSSASTAITGSINYIIGAPSFELFCDSYNAHYGLTGDEPSIPTGNATYTERRKIFYYYPYDTNNYGYAVGPGYKSGTVTNYLTSSSNYLVLTDSAIDSMYYSNSKYYWLASPSAYTSNYVMYVSGDNGGCVDNENYIYSRAFCPLVSLKSNVQLELAD